MRFSSPLGADVGRSEISLASSADESAAISIGDSSHNSEVDKLVVVGKKEQLAGRESKLVLWLRILVVFVLLAVTTVASVGIFVYSRSNEVEQFRVDFNGFGEKVISAIQEGSYRKMQTMDSLASSLTAYALEQNQSWPFVKVSNSANLFEPHLSLAGAASIVLQPIVKAQERDAWEDYSQKQQKWISDDIEARDDLFKTEWNETEARRLEGKDQAVEPVSKYIKTYVGVDTTPGPYVVWWQYAPVIKNSWFINFNRLASVYISREGCCLWFVQTPPHAVLRPLLSTALMVLLKTSRLSKSVKLRFPSTQRGNS